MLYKEACTRTRGVLIRQKPLVRSYTQNGVVARAMQIISSEFGDAKACKIERPYHVLQHGKLLTCPPRQAGR